jgi:ABC-2 type transport system ATP-binding protein
VEAEIRAIIEREGGTCKIDNPTATMEDLFLNIVRESEARPGARRVSGSGTEQDSEDEGPSADENQGEAGQ